MNKHSRTLKDFFKKNSLEIGVAGSVVSWKRLMEEGDQNEEKAVLSLQQEKMHPLLEGVISVCSLPVNKCFFAWSHRRNAIGD